VFIANFNDGSSFSENDGLWDDLPRKPITALHLTLPVQAKMLNKETNKVIDLPPPTVQLENFDQYYFANEAVSVIFRTQGGVTFFDEGKGTLVKQVIAGVDKKHDLVVYVAVDRKANVEIKRFPISKFNVNPEALREGFIDKKRIDPAPAIK
jgi:hypothetical protein